MRQPIFMKHGFGDNGFICSLDDREYHKYVNRDEEKANADFIAHAPGDMRFLLNENRWLRRRLDKAEKSLVSAGYTDNGGEMWKPPIGKPPDFDEIDRLRRRLRDERRENMIDRIWMWIITAIAIVSIVWG